MSEIKPQFLDELAYPAKFDRQFPRDILTEGIVEADDLKVTELDTPGMGVKVASGVGYVQGDQSTTQGHYRIYNDASKNLTIAASDPTHPRKDRIIAQIYDSVDIGGAEDEWVLEVLTGTPAASPVVPDLPDDALSLAIVDIEANETTILNADITDQRTQIDLQNLALNDLTTHIAADPIDHPDRSILPAKMKIEWKDWTPNYSASGSMTFTSVTTYIAKYIVIDKMCYFQLSCNGTTGGSVSTGIEFTLPINCADSTGVYIGGGCGSYDGPGVYRVSMWVNLNASKLSVFKYDGANWGLGTGRRILIQGFYRIA